MTNAEYAFESEEALWDFILTIETEALKDWREGVEHALDAVNAALDKASYGDSPHSDLLEAHATLDSLLVADVLPEVAR